MPGGTILIATTPLVGQANGRVVAMIRPESIKLVPTASSALCGRVESVNFIGDKQRVSITGAAAKSLTADVSNSIAIKLGDRVGLAIEPREIRLLPGDSA